MPGLCVVPMCHERGGHKFPQNAALRKLWLIAIRRDKWLPNGNSLVCRQHFVSSDYKESTAYGKALTKALTVDKRDLFSVILF